ncbi:hypothetical protein [Nocardia sp. NPDC005978]|uniref:hypothetical protein n=1 Tax=unclassified Nocardia TaxID=2637762 RepID=UPI0033A41394
MALTFSPGLVTSDITPEIAWHVAASEGDWVLSWLPERRLSRQAAISGMVLDEVLSDPDPADPELVLELAAARAADLGLTLPQVVERLALRVLQRDAQRNRPALGHLHRHGAVTPAGW